MLGKVKILGVIRKNRTATIIVGVVFLVALGTLLFMLFRPISVAQRAANDTLRLSNDIEDLEKSLGQPGSSSQTIKTYLHHLTAIQKRCENIRRDTLAIKDDGTSSETVTSVVTNTSDLCKDVDTLAGDSLDIYQTVSPLLMIDTKLKAYQTLPFVRDRIRSANTSAVTSALAGLGGKQKLASDFPTSIPTWTKELDNTVKTSHHLDYLVALRHYQEQVLAERQQYWTTYGDIHALAEELSHQLGRYCQELGLSKSSVVCKASAN